jgi:hypothetical protein
LRPPVCSAEATVDRGVPSNAQMVRFALALGVASCYSCPEGRFTSCDRGMPHECEALQLVWRDGMGERAEPPPIEWIHDFVPDEDPNVRGVFLSQCFEIRLRIERNIADSAYVHELMHAHLLLSTGDADPRHMRNEWYTQVSDLQGQLHKRGF